MSYEYEAANRALIEELSAQLAQARAEAINNGVAARLARARILELEGISKKSGASETEEA